MVASENDLIIINETEDQLSNTYRKYANKETNKGQTKQQYRQD